MVKDWRKILMALLIKPFEAFKKAAGRASISCNCDLK